VYRLVSEVATARTATWVTLAAGLVLAVVLAIAWVLLRRRRDVTATGRIG
jgi:LPXTG-motif cell wall-anchored protein